MSEDAEYATVRLLLGSFIGSTLIDISQHDYEDFERDGKGFVMLHFSNNRAIYIGLDGKPMAYDSDEPTVEL